jgi:hypothetical protein
MNERIKLLAKQAGTYFGGGTTDYFGDYLPPYVSITDLDLEKFAELIVRECIEISKKIETDLKSSDMFTESNAASNAAGLVAYRIAQNFGVEE